MKRTNSGRPSRTAHQVTDHLLISGIFPVTQGNIIEEYNVSLIIDAHSSKPNKPAVTPRDGLEVLKVNVNDNEKANLYRHFDYVCDKIHDHRRKGGVTLVGY